MTLYTHFPSHLCTIWKCHTTILSIETKPQRQGLWQPWHLQLWINLFPLNQNAAVFTRHCQESKNIFAVVCQKVITLKYI